MNSKPGRSIVKGTYDVDGRGSGGVAETMMSVSAGKDTQRLKLGRVQVADTMWKSGSQDLEREQRGKRGVNKGREFQNDEGSKDIQ